MASVTFKRTNNIDSVPIVDGQLIFGTSDKKIYLDNGNTREVYGGGSGTDLISDVSDATDNNAFNANATVNLFTRKSSIVDTKAEIQSVTQAGVPLGCKGFNEVIGTGDISELGDGSVTGAILANKSAIDTVNQNLTKCVLYDETTDMEYVYVAGSRVDIGRAYAQGLRIFANGTALEPINFTSSDFLTGTGYRVSEGSWHITDGYLTAVPPSASTITVGSSWKACGTNKIDISRYNELVIVMANDVEYKVNVSTLSGEYYIELWYGANKNGSIQSYSFYSSITTVLKTDGQLTDLITKTVAQGGLGTLQVKAVYLH